MMLEMSWPKEDVWLSVWSAELPCSVPMTILSPFTTSTLTIEKCVSSIDSRVLVYTYVVHTMTIPLAFDLRDNTPSQTVSLSSAYI
jgi:hypothetical protein